MNVTFRRQIINAALFAAVLGAAAPAFANKPETPATLEGGKVISVDEAKKLLDGKGALFIDTRSVVNFGKGRVPGAQTAAYKEKSEPVQNFNAADDSFELEKLPKDKAAVLSFKAGHKNVMYLRGGMADWTAKNLPVER